MFIGPEVEIAAKSSSEVDWGVLPEAAAPTVKLAIFLGNSAYQLPENQCFTSDSNVVFGIRLTFPVVLKVVM